jgi:hypothetical protein
MDGLPGIVFPSYTSPVPSNSQEAEIQAKIIKLYNLIKKHLDRWQTTGSIVTVNALIDSKNVVMSFLTALEYVQVIAFRLLSS